MQWERWRKPRPRWSTAHGAKRTPTAATSPGRWEATWRAGPLGVDTFASHVLPLDQAPHAYEIFQKKQDGAVKVILRP